MASGPDLRIGDAERDATTRQLRECFAQGRLTMDEFNDRLGQALSATTQLELDRLTQDLPPARPSPAPLPSTAGYRGDPRYAYNPRGDHGWQGTSSGCGTRMRSRVTMVLVGLFVLWLLLSTVLTPLALFPFGGRIALLLLVFGVLRGIVRRLFGLGRRR
jgi:uncharacterized protein DUF1707